jgi:hypothetical protein
MGNEIDSKVSENSIFSFGKEDDPACGEMSLKQRVLGWLICSVSGNVISWIMTFLFIFGSLSAAAFGAIFGLCQVLNIAASCFLSTPKGHYKAMKKKHRIIPSVVYIVCIIMTFVIAFATGVPGLVLLCVVITTIAYYWYTISFIPYGTKILKKICGTCFDM